MAASLSYCWMNISGLFCSRPPPFMTAACIVLELCLMQESSNDGDMHATVQALLDSNSVVVMATSSCPFCIEVRDCTTFREDTEKPFIVSWCSTAQLNTTAVGKGIFERGVETGDEQLSPQHKQIATLLLVQLMTVRGRQTTQDISRSNFTPQQYFPTAHGSSSSSDLSGVQT